jgi:hypothetical protein
MLQSWKTTLIGLLTGVGYLFLSSLQSGVKPRDAALAAGVTVLGALAKDHSAPSQ